PSPGTARGGVSSVERRIGGRVFWGRLLQFEAVRSFDALAGRGLWPGGVLRDATRPGPSRGAGPTPLRRSPRAGRLLRLRRLRPASALAVAALVPNEDQGGEDQLLPAAPTRAIHPGEGGPSHHSGRAPTPDARA